MQYKTHFIKSNDFKTVQGSGVFGGITSTGQININFFTERAPIPETIVLDVDEKTGQVIREVSREGKDGIIRETHFGVLFDIEVAKNVVGWLNEKIKLFEENKPLEQKNKKQ